MGLYVILLIILAVAVACVAIHHLVNPKTVPQEPIKLTKHSHKEDRTRYTKRRIHRGRREVYDSHTNEWLLWQSVYGDVSYYTSELPVEHRREPVSRSSCDTNLVMSSSWSDTGSSSSSYSPSYSSSSSSSYSSDSYSSSSSSSYSSDTSSSSAF